MTERFTLLTELGRGGMGVVWKARDEETGQIVALKLLREAYAEDPEYLARFERELELAKRIDSVHVVKVLGFGVRQRVPYLALEYVDGPSLHDALIAHGPYSWAETRALLIQMTQGLADANAAAVIHRDVKPSNVLIDPDGIAKLTDFGIARGLDSTRMTATSTMLGTPAYLAPEGPKDARSDLYSLEIIGYQLLTGEVPFKGTTYQEVIIEHMRTPPDLNRLPAEARPTIGWLLAKDPAERPQRASALLPVLYGAAQAPAVTGTMQMPPSRAEVPAPRPASLQVPIPSPTIPRPAQAPTLAPPFGWTAQPAPPPAPGALWAPIRSANPVPRAYRIPLVGAVVVIIGWIVAWVPHISYWRGSFANLLFLGVLALASAAALSRTDQHATWRKILPVVCTLIGVVALWNNCSWLVTNPGLAIDLGYWRHLLSDDPGWIVMVFGDVTVLVGGILSVVQVRSTALPGLSPTTRP